MLCYGTHRIPFSSPAAEWVTFNTTVGGRLVETVPIASVCHYDNSTDYDAAACAALREVWDYPQTHDGSSSSPMAQFFTNGCCNPGARGKAYLRTRRATVHFMMVVARTRPTQLAAPVPKGAEAPALSTSSGDDVHLSGMNSRARTK